MRFWHPPATQDIQQTYSVAVHKVCEAWHDAPVDSLWLWYGAESSVICCLDS